MKFLKKAISLVLVFAMLAGFAGMTGFEASAFRTTFTTAGGIKVEMAPTLYKTKATSANLVSYDGNANEVGDYVILAADNDLVYYFTFPEGVKWFNGGLSAKPNTAPTDYQYLWGNLEYADWNNGSVCYFPRNESNAQGNDYGVLFGKIDDTTGYGNGFENVDTIYWVVRYAYTDEEPAEGSSDWKYDTWSIPLVAKENASNNSGNPDTTANKPPYDKTREQGVPSGHNINDYAVAGCQIRVDGDGVVHFGVPATIYTSGGKVISSVTSAYGTSENYGTIYAEIPQWAQSVKLDIVNESDTTIVNIWNDNKTALEALKPDYYLTDPEDDGTDYYVKIKNILKDSGNINGRNDVFSTVGGKKCIIYRLEYVCNKNLSNSYEVLSTPVTYTQYAASYVEELKYHRAGYEADMFNSGKSGSYAKVTLAVFETMEFSPLLKLNGLNIQPSFKNDGTNSTVRVYEDIDFATYGTNAGAKAKTGMLACNKLTSNGIFYLFFDYGDSGTLRAATYKMHVHPGNDDAGIGKESSQDNVKTGRTVGAKVYFDPQAKTWSFTESGPSSSTKTAQIKMVYDYYQSREWGNAHQNNSLIGYWTALKDVGAESKYEYIGEGNKITHSDGTAGDWTGKESNDGTDGITGITYSGNPSAGNKETTDPTTTFTVDFSKFSSNKYIRFISQTFTNTKTGDWSYKADIGFYTGYHIDIINVGRTNAHNLIKKAVSCNYVKEEMDSTWWDNYRTSVINAYVSCGDLKHTEVADESYINSPDYRVADYTKLADALNAVKTEIDLDTSDSYSGENCSWYYTTASWNQFKTTLNEATRVYKDLRGSTTFDFTESYDSSNSGKGPACYRQDMIDTMTDAVKRAKSVLKKYADYSELLERLNGKDDLPDYDKEGANAISTFDGSQWYTQETWDNFVSKRNALVALTGNGGTFNVNTGISNNYTRGSLTEDDQSLIDNAVAAFDTAKAALKFKPMSEYKDATSGKSYATLVEEVNNKYNSLNGTIPVYTITADGQLDTTSKKVNIYNLTELAAAKASVLAIAATADMAPNYTNFGNLLTAYNNVYVNTLGNTNPADRSGWQSVFDRLTAIVNDPNVTIKQDTFFTDFINKYYIDTNIVDGKGDKANAINNIFTQYNATIDITTARDAQGSINAQVDALYKALKTEMPSKAVAEAIESARNAGKGTFTVYNPYNMENYESHALYHAFGAAAENGIAVINKFDSGTVRDLNIEIEAVEDDNSYNMFTTPVATLNTVANLLLAKAKPTTEGGMLIEETAKLEVLKAAIDGASQALALKVTAAHPSSDETKDIVFSRYTEKSTEELRAVYNLALAYYEANATETTNEKGETVITTALTIDKQLEIDKLVFQLLDEIENSRRLLSESVEKDHWTWTYYDKDSNVTTDENAIASAKCEAANAEDYFTAEKWNTLLHNTISVSGKDNGLALNTAYYEFLKAELSTPYTDENGNRVDDITPVWDEDGWLILDNGEVPETSLIFGESWGTYKTRYEEALEIWKSYEGGTVDDVSKQGDIDKAAEHLYKARLALKFKQSYFPTNKDAYEQACLWFAEIEAYALVTPINRYGQAWVEVGVDKDNDGIVDTDDEGNEITELQLLPSDDPSDIAEENVYLHTGVDAELVASITEFKAKYASPNSTEPFDVKGAHETLYLAIKAEIEKRACELKSADHDDFKAGLDDLEANYIAGTLDGTTYTKNALVLSDEQSAVLQDMLDDVQGEMTGDATSLLGQLISKETDDIHTYTLTTEAKDMEFASLMRGYLIEFMQLKYTSTSPEFYDNGVTREFYIFNQNQVNNYIEDIDLFYYNTAEVWPTIYEVNNLAIQEVTPGRFVIDYPGCGVEWDDTLTGMGYPPVDSDLYPEGQDAMDPVDEKIFEIYNKIGAFSSYYSDIFEHTNNYYTSPLVWISENAIKKVGGEKLILADLDANSSLSSKATVEDKQLGMDENQNWRTVEVGFNVNTNSNYWYSEGYDYYTDNATGRAYYLYESTNEIYGSSYNSWFTDGTVGDLEDYINTGLKDAISYDFPVVNNVANLQAIGKNQEYYIEWTLWDIQDLGWQYSFTEQLVIDVTALQATIDTAAKEYYNNIRKLQLLPATKAYREVEEAYQAAMAKTVTWSSTVDVNHIIALTTSGDSFADLKKTFNGEERTVARFYNTTSTFLTGIGDANYAIIDGGHYSPSLPGQYDKTNADWLALENFHSSFADTDMITIDKAELVTAVDLSDADGYTVKETDSPMEKLIKYLYALDLVAYDFKELNEFVSAFLSNPSADADNALNTLATNTNYNEKYSFTGTYYNAKYYTTESLKAVYDLLKDSGVIKQAVYNDAVSNGYVMDMTFDQTEHVAAFYDEPKYGNNDVGNPSIVALTRDLAAQIKALKLDAADKTALSLAINHAIDIIENQTEIYVVGDAKWNEFIAALYAGADGQGTIDNPAVGTALYIQKKCDINVEGYYTKAENQGFVNTATDTLNNKIGALNKKADNTAPKMTVLTGKDELEAFYASQNKVDSNKENEPTNADYLRDAEAGATPAAATLLMANNGYSLLVYTNQLNPRIVITLQDISGIIDAAKGETFEIAAVRTSGVDANLIYGSMNANGAITNIAKTAVTAGSTFNGFSNETKTDGSSVFAILAPTFDGKSGKETQQARYTIKAYDKAGSTDGFGAQNNFVDKLYLGGNDAEGTKVTVRDSKEITIHIYYHNSMSSVNDEGITVDENGKPVETTPVAEKVNRVPGAYFDGELTYNGRWRSGVILERRFSSMVRNWEFVSEVKNNQISGCAVSGYNDPDFGALNTGSFYYVLDRTADAAVYDQYFEDKKTDKGIIDYTAASTAKQTMLDNMNEAKLTAMRESGRFYDYGQDIQWSQALGKKIADGDLIFVHIVDRWGNVVNRIMEVPNFDNVAPKAVSPSAGIVNIEENGGSGIANINVWNGLEFEEMVAADYEVVDSQKQQITLKDGGTATVSCSGNVLTISGLVPGGGYSIDIYDNAGNVKIVGTRASGADESGKGSIQIKITDVANGVIDDSVSSGEEGATVQQSAMFTLNGTDMVILNTGMESSIINADIKGNVLANQTVYHTITTKDTVTQIKSVRDDGQTEEWTKTKSYVTDNGDGTLTWIITRKFTEGEHSYKVYAMVDGAYETFSAPCSVTATTKTVVLTVKNAGPGRTIIVYSGSIEQKNSTFKSYVIPYGAEVKITATTTKADSEFYYWFSNVNNRILSTADVYSFTAVSNVDCSAQFTSDEMLNNNKKLVVYVNNAKNVIKAYDLADGEPYTVPAGPILPDYTFKGWNMTPAEVYASENDVVVVEPVYELNVISTVTIPEGNYTTTGAGEYASENNKRPTVTISASMFNDDGEEFLYWYDVDTNELVSYNRIYTFYCVKNTVIVPVYGDASTIVPAPIVRLTSVKYSALNGKVSFFAERSVPEEFIIHKTGIVVTRNESIGTNEEVFVLGGTSTTSGASTNTLNNGYYSANVDITTGQTVWARAYAICEDESGEIFEVYGPIASYTLK